MAPSPDRRGPAHYELRIDGHLDDHWSAWFGDLNLTHHRDGTTSISGLVSDQAQLYGLLMKVRDLGVALISVAVIDRPASVDDVDDHRSSQSSALRQDPPTRRQIPSVTT